MINFSKNEDYSILQIEISKVPIKENYLKILKENDINTLLDLVNQSKEEINEKFPYEIFPFAYAELSMLLHRAGFVFKNEYLHIGLLDNLARVDLRNIGLPMNILSELNTAGFNILGELLSLKESELIKLCNSNLTMQDIEKIKTYIYNIGLAFNSDDIVRTRIQNKLGYIQNYINWLEPNELKSTDILLDKVVENLSKSTEKKHII